MLPQCWTSCRQRMTELHHPKIALGVVVEGAGVHDADHRVGVREGVEPLIAP